MARSGSFNLTGCHYHSFQLFYNLDRVSRKWKRPPNEHNAKNNHQQNGRKTKSIVRKLSCRNVSCGDETEEGERERRKDVLAKLVVCSAGVCIWLGCRRFGYGKMERNKRDIKLWKQNSKNTNTPNIFNVAAFKMYDVFCIVLRKFGPSHITHFWYLMISWFRMVVARCDKQTYKQTTPIADCLRIYYHPFHCAGLL